MAPSVIYCPHLTRESLIMNVDLERLQKDVKDARKNVQQILKSMEHVVDVVMAMQGIQRALHEVSPPLENFLSVISDKRPEDEEMQMDITLDGDSDSAREHKRVKDEIMPSEISTDFTATAI